MLSVQVSLACVSCRIINVERIFLQENLCWKLFFMKHRLHWGHRMLQNTSQMPMAHWDSNKAQCRLHTPASSHVILSLRKRHIRSTTKTHTLSSKVIQVGVLWEFWDTLLSNMRELGQPTQQYESSRTVNTISTPPLSNQWDTSS